MSADGGRELWEARFDVGVGPLHFGMSPAEVARVLSAKPQTRVGDPYGREDYPNGVKAFYDAGSLACVALDAVIGPQAFLAGFPTGGQRSWARPAVPSRPRWGAWELDPVHLRRVARADRCRDPSA